jgi:hypothetical protein
MEIQHASVHLRLTAKQYDATYARGLSGVY